MIERARRKYKKGMAKYLIAASYTAQGLRGLANDKASGRQKAIEQSLTAVGGRLEAIYYAFGEHDVYVIFDCPDNVSAAAISLAASASGLVRTITIPLLTVMEADAALTMKVNYRPPGA